MMKKCFKCGEVKDLSDFYKHKGMADGHLNKCKECSRKESIDYRNKNIEAARDYDRRRANTAARVAARNAYAKTEQGIATRRKAQKKYAESHRIEATDRCRKYRADNPKKSRAHDLVAYAVRIGTLVRMPCEVCGCDSHVAHHDDYDKPLDVRWLCGSHHREWHEQNGEGANAK